MPLQDPWPPSLSATVVLVAGRGAERAGYQQYQLLS